MSRPRSSRASAVRARSLFKELDNEDDDIKPNVGAGKRKRKDLDEEFDISQVPDDTSDNEIPDENISSAEQNSLNQFEDDDEEEEEAPDSNEMQRRRAKLLDLWSDFIEIPKTELRQIPDEVRNRWKKKQKKFTCPEKECHKSFTTIPGVVYHYKRCGISVVEQDSVKCKLCTETAPLAKKLLYHLFNNHLPLLPAPPEELTIGLEDRKATRAGIGPQRKGWDSSMYFEATLQNRQENEGKNLFPNHMPLRSQWKPLSAQQSATYLPLAEDSVNLKVKGDKKWRRLMRFESVDDDFHKTFFAGGPVFSAAWLPVPTDCHEVCDQILALGVGLNFEDGHAFSDQDAEFGLLQFWNFGNITNKRSDSIGVKPCLSFGIALSDGIVWDMKWCPFGNTFMSPSHKVRANQFPRLGLLCLACGNGVVKILSIPHLQFISSSHSSSPPIYSPTPVIILDPPGVGPLTNHEPSICKCISWNKTQESRHIAAGFGSGVIAVWDLETKSRFLKSDETTSDCLILLPLHSFSAHGTAVTALSWCPYQGSLLLASGSSLDRDLVFWDLRDPGSAFRVTGKKMHATGMEWSFKWNGVFVSQDDGFSNQNTAVVFVSPIMKERPTSSTCVHKSTVWSASYNEWCNVEASGDASGEVVAYRGFDDSVERRRKSDYRFPIYRMEPVSLEEESDQNETLSHTYENSVNRLGVQFHDLNLSCTIPAEHWSRIRSAETMNWQHPSNYPLVSVNHVAWNPNKNSFAWIFTGSQNGVCRITYLPLLLNQ